jgi:hypothetical protein
MGGKKIVLRAFIVFFFMIALVHTVFHFSTFGLSLTNNNPIVISGLAVNDPTNTILPEKSAISFSVLGIEWLILITLAIFAIVRQKMQAEIQKTHYNIKQIFRESQSKTDIDILYELLKNYGTIKVSAAAKLFNVENDKIIEWCNILEVGDLASLNYPQIGEPEIVFKK